MVAKSTLPKHFSFYLQKSLRNGLLFVQAWVVGMVCLRGSRACVGDVDGVLAWVAL